MGFFSLLTKKQATADCTEPGGQTFRPPASAQPPPMHHYATAPEAPYGRGLPYQHANHAVSMPAFTGGDGSLGPPPKYDAAAPCPPQNFYPPPNIVVNQHYYISAPLPGIPETVLDKVSAMASAPTGISKFHLGSVANLASDLLPGMPHFFDNRSVPSTSCQVPGTTLLNQGAALYDQLSSKFDRVVTAIDRDRYEGNEGELFSYGPSPPQAGQLVPGAPRPDGKSDYPKGQTTGVVSLLMSGNYFAKVDIYANSKLPLNLRPMELYIASYRLLCLAATYSDRAYVQPQGAERFAHIDADWRTGTKAMVIKSVPMDDANTIVFAIRGTANFMDWAVNLNMAPTSPECFLDDQGNLCHAGFLSVARKMVRPVAARLRQLIEEDPSRASYTLLITGHSAGGAVASLLYSHMMATSTSAASELNLLTGCFRRVHCITFGTPPISLLPLKKPRGKEFNKCLFYTFVNEGDPVVRADRAYVKSLIDLFSSPVPKTATAKDSTAAKAPRKDASRTSLHSNKTAKSHHSDHKSKHGSHSSHGGNTSRGGSQKQPVWKVPPATLSNAGRIVVLRSGDPRAGLAGKKTVDERLSEGVVAQFTTDEQLRGVIWGDPVCHVMKLYAGRIEALAIAAVTAGP